MTGRARYLKKNHNIIDNIQFIGFTIVLLSIFDDIIVNTII